jgi:hypothetical protein
LQTPVVRFSLLITNPTPLLTDHTPLKLALVDADADADAVAAPLGAAVTSIPPHVRPEMSTIDAVRRRLNMATT